MPAMKVTPDAAMRARDVSRPHAEHLERAEEADAGVGSATNVVIEAAVAVESAAATEAGHWSAGVERLAMTAAFAEVDIPDPESPGSKGPGSESPSSKGVGSEGPGSESPSSGDRPADAGRVEGTRRRRVRNVRSSSRRGRPSR